MTLLWVFPSSVLLQSCSSFQPSYVEPCPARPKPDIVRRFASLTPNAKVEVITGAAHLTPWDGKEQNVRVVREFLRSVDENH